MLATVAMMMLLAADTDPQRDIDHDVTKSQQQGEPTDPLFDKPYVPTDAPAFVLSIIESTRQGELEARRAAERLRLR